MNDKEFGNVIVRYEPDEKLGTLVCSYFKGSTFDKRQRQSAMVLEDPNSLYLWYAKACMSFRLFVTNPKKILIIGLGSGTLTKYLYKEFPKAKIDSVDIDAGMIQACKESFFVPHNKRSNLIEADGSVFVKECKTGTYDAVFLDGFGAGHQDDSTLIQCLNNEDFYNHTKRILKPTGVVVSNLLLQKNAVYALIQKCFSKRTYRINQMYQGNNIVLAFKNPHIWFRNDLDTLSESLMVESEPNKINYPLFLKAIIRNGGRHTDKRFIV